jgi:capsular polysaccharide biosynthesis protein
MSGWELKEIDHFVVNSLRSGFQRDTIKLAGIESSRIVQSDKAKYFLCEDMIQPSFPGTTLYPVKWVCDYLVETLLPKKRPEKVPTAPKLYIPRRNVPRRRILNQDELESFLVRQGFKVIDPAEHDVPTQAQLFDQAEVIVAPHGSGLTNLVFCRTGTTVIELFPPSVMPLCYWILGSQMDLKYFYYIGTEPRGARHSDFAVNIDELNSLLEESGLKTR